MLLTNYISCINHIKLLLKTLSLQENRICCIFVLQDRYSNPLSNFTCGSDSMFLVPKKKNELNTLLYFLVVFNKIWKLEAYIPSKRKHLLESFSMQKQSVAAKRTDGFEQKKILCFPNTIFKFLIIYLH